ncbi:MAG: ribonuclease H-like domain-containing protein [Alphaproteobacteria bacterium]|nr:ribonuclease H-like domain-containing protein [Alphaproteobacteria bacterium]HAQ33690.1 ribonuclease D [Rhodospirillaceae bacterium]MDP6660387.1 ribonuclease H-like domain-containing protein [Alphaproteobacteria bacterium]MDP6780586.1 ribonuclease H-like domain-containing protein [Alphaproteobacteria bacterium]MDP7044745.1 ribonuclease H-like domain-containing protein [Alphaproteobacteria bacterium]
MAGSTSKSKFKQPGLNSLELHRGDLAAGVDFGDCVAVDTETMGLDPHRDRLCLVQLSDKNGNCHMVHFHQPSYDAPNLKVLMDDPKVTKLFHYARFDVAVLNHYIGASCTPLYCTKIASKLVRTFTDRHGLKNLCSELLGIDLSKQQQSSDWGADDLTPEQMQYAAGDVVYLHRLREKLDVLLAREDRAELAKACFEFLPVRVALDLAGWDEEDIFSH